MGSLMKLFDGIPSTLALYARISSSALALVPKKISKKETEKIARPASPFAFFYQEKSSPLKEQNPGMLQKDIMKLASALWRNSTNYEQQQYKNVFNQRMEEYKQTVKEPPKRPPTPYIQFFIDQSDSLRYQYPNVIERTKRAGELWKQLPEDEKSQYKDAYSNKLHEFLENLTEEEKLSIQNKREALNVRRERQNIRRYGKEAWKEKPTVSPVNPFVEFMRRNMSAVPKEEKSLVHLGQAWRELSGNEKLEYKEFAQQTAERQRQEVVEWQEKHDIH